MDGAGVSRACRGGRMVNRGRRRGVRETETKHESGGGAQVVLTIIAEIFEVRVQVVHLAQANGHMPRGVEVKADAAISGKRVFVTRRGIKENCVGDEPRGSTGAQARPSYQRVSKRRPATLTKKEMRAEQIGVNLGVDMAHVVQH